MKSRERRLSSWSNATCAMPPCEALSSRRGRRPHHAQKDRVGTWYILRLTSDDNVLVRTGRRGAVADDARAREVGLRYSSCEADEQRGAIRCGAGGAKGGGQGECGPAKHAPDLEPHKRDKDAGSYTAKTCRRYPRWEPYAGKPHVRILQRGARGNSRPYRDRRELSRFSAARQGLAARGARAQPSMPVDRWFLTPDALVCIIYGSLLLRALKGHRVRSAGTSLGICWEQSPVASEHGEDDRLLDAGRMVGSARRAISAGSPVTLARPHSLSLRAFA